MPEHLRSAVLLGLSQGCGSVRCADCGSLTSISRAVSCTQGGVQVDDRDGRTTEDEVQRRAGVGVAGLDVAAVGVGGRGRHDFLATDGCGAQGKNWDVERAFADAVEKVDGLPDGFRFHDLRRYFASVLIAGECE